MAELSEFFPQEATPTLEQMVPSSPSPEVPAHKPSVLNLSAQGAYLNSQMGGDNLEGDYRAIAGDMTSSGQSSYLSSISSAAVTRRDESNKKALVNIVTDPSISIETKAASIESVKSSSTNVNVRTLIAEQAIIAPSKGETKVQAESRTNLVKHIELLDEVKRKENEALALASQRIRSNTGTTVFDALSLLIPGVSEVSNASAARQRAASEGKTPGQQIAAGTKAFFLPGETRESLAERIRNIPPLERGPFIQAAVDAYRNSEGVLFGDQNQLEAAADLEAAATGHYPTWQRVVDSSMVVLDALGVGGMLKAGKSLLKGSTAVKTVEATGVAGKAVEGAVGASEAATGATSVMGRPFKFGEGGRESNRVQNVTAKLISSETGEPIPLAAKNIVKSQVSPISTSQIVKDTNPEQARAIHAIMATDETGEAAKALYGTTREDAIAHDVLPDIGDGSGVVANKVANIASPIGIDERVANTLSDNGAIHYSPKEKETQRARVVNDFKGNIGLTSRTEMFGYEVSIKPIEANWTPYGLFDTVKSDAGYVSKHTGWPGESGVASVKDPMLDWQGKTSPFYDELPSFKLKSGAEIRVISSKIQASSNKNGEVSYWVKGSDLDNSPLKIDPDFTVESQTRHYKEGQEQWHKVAVVKMEDNKLAHIVVRDQLQGQGLGTKLLDDAVKRFGLNPFNAPDRSVKGAGLLNSYAKKLGGTLKHEELPTGGRISGVFGPSEGGFSTAKEASEAIQFHGRSYGITDKDVGILQRVGDRYVPVTLEEASKVENGDFLATVKFDYELQAKTMEGAYEALTPVRTWLNRFKWGGGKWFGDAHSNLLDAPSFMHPVVMAANFHAVGRAAGLEKSLSLVAKDFAEGYAGLNKADKAAINVYVRKANESAITLSETSMRANGLNEKARDLMYKWKAVWDNVWHLENRDLIQTHTNRGYGMFVDKTNGTQLIAKELKSSGQAISEFGGNKNLMVYDSVIDAARPMSADEVTRLYDKGGNIAELRNAVKADDGYVKYVINENKAGNSYVRALTNSDNVLNYRPGYYQVHYKDPVFIIKEMRDANGKVIQSSAIATSETEIGAKRIRDSFIKANEDDKVTYTYRKDVKGFGRNSEEYWDQMHAQGRTAQMTRGKQLETSTSNLHYLEHENILDPVDALTRSIHSAAVRTSMRDTLESMRQRFIAMYGHLYESEKAGMKRMPDSRAEIGSRKGFNTKEVAEARTSLEYIRKMEEGYVNAIDEASKAAFDVMADALGAASDSRAMEKVEKALRAAGNVGPVHAAKSMASTLMIAMNPLRQLILNSHQHIRSLALDPKYVASGEMYRDFVALMWAKTGLPMPEKLLKFTSFDSITELKDALRYSQSHGLTSAVDAHNFVRADMQKLAATTLLEKASKVAGAPAKFMREVGFDAGENINQITSWLLFRKQAKNQGLPLNAETYANVHAKGINFSGGMNRAGAMPYSETVLAGPMQFGQVIHKMLLQDFTNRMLTTKERAKLLTLDTILFGGPIGGVAASGMFDQWLPEDRDLRRTLKVGIEELMLNKLISLAQGGKSSIDFSGLAPGSTNFVLETTANLFDTGLTDMLLRGGPSGTIFFGGDSKLGLFARSLARYVGAMPDYDIAGMPKTDALEVIRNAARLTSGGSNYLNAKFMMETNRWFSRSGYGMEEVNGFLEPYAQAAGFGNRNEAMRYEVSKEVYEKSTSFKEDTSLVFKELFNHWTAHGIDQSTSGVTAQSFAFVNQIFGSGIKGTEANRQFVSELKKKMESSSEFNQSIIRAGNFMDYERYKNAVIMSQGTEEGKRVLLQIGEDINNYGKSK